MTQTQTALKFRNCSPRKTHPDWSMLQAQAIRQANEILPLIHKDSDDTLRDRIEDKWRRTRAAAQAAENFIVNRKRFKENNHAFRPLYFIWSMLNSCNFRCTYCEDNRGNAYPDLKDEPLGYEQRLKLLEIMRTGTNAVYFCGGEPTLLQDLPKYTDYAYRLGYYPMMVNTNGFNLHAMLKKPAWRKWLRQMDTIIVSLDSLNVSRLKVLWGVNRVEQVLVNLLMLRELRKAVDFKLMINAVILHDTVDQVSDLLDFINDLEDVWFVAVPVGLNSDKTAPKRVAGEGVTSRDDYQKLASKIIARKKDHLMAGSVRMLEMFKGGKPPNCLPTLRPQIDPDGLIAWPCRATKNVKPVYINLLEHKSVDDAWNTGLRHISATNFYGEGEDQCGEVCLYMKTYSTARYFEALANPWSSAYLSEMYEFVFKT